MSDPLRVGLVGLNFGRKLAAGGRKNGSIEIVSCYSPFPAECEKFAADFDCRISESVEEMAAGSEIEAVLIAAPNNEHAGLAWKAASHGKHVFIEKPIANSVADAREIIAFCRKAGVKLCVGHNHRNFGSSATIRRLIGEGAIGRPLAVECHCGSANAFGLEPGNWRRSELACPSMALIQMGIHPIDTMRTVLGEVLSVSAHFESVMVEMANPDLNAVILEFESGATGVMVTSYIHNDFYMVWHGSEGVLRYMYWPDEGKIERLDRLGHVDESNHWIEFEPVDSLGAELADFRDAVREGREPEVNGEEGLRSLLPVVAAIESDKMGRRVFIDEII